jgi:hypothetical protein
MLNKRQVNENYPEKTFTFGNVARGNGMVPELRAVFHNDRVALVPADGVNVFHDQREEKRPKEKKRFSFAKNNKPRLWYKNYYGYKRKKGPRSPNPSHLSIQSDVRVGEPFAGVVDVVAAPKAKAARAA